MAVLFLFKDSPDEEGISLVDDGGINLAQRRRGAEGCSGVETAHLNDDYKSYVSRWVFRNPRVWIIAIADFFVYTVRFAALDWGIVHLMDGKWGETPLAFAFYTGFAGSAPVGSRN